MSLAEPMVTATEHGPDAGPLDDVAAIVTAMHRRMPDVSRVDLEWAVGQALRSFADARVRLYVPILVERSALSHLRVRAMHGGGAST